MPRLQSARNWNCALTCALVGVLAGLNSSAGTSTTPTTSEPTANRTSATTEIAHENPRPMVVDFESAVADPDSLLPELRWSVCCSTLQQAEAGDWPLRARRPADLAALQSTRSTGDLPPSRRRHARTFARDPSHLMRVLVPSPLVTALAALSSPLPLSLQVLGRWQASRMVRPSIPPARIPHPPHSHPLCLAPVRASPH